MPAAIREGEAACSRSVPPRPEALAADQKVAHCAALSLASTTGHFMALNGGEKWQSVLVCERAARGGTAA